MISVEYDSHLMAVVEVPEILIHRNDFQVLVIHKQPNSTLMVSLYLILSFGV
jgi:hypothetical protein